VAIRSALINVMAAAANKAGRALIHDFGEVEQLQVSRKGPGDYVSTADTNAEQIIRYELQKEAGVIAGTDSSNRWIVDPLDGTFNFLHGLPHFSISIALERDGSPMCGVVYDPVKDELFWAERGQGAFLNDRRLRVSGRSKLTDAAIACGLPLKNVDDSPEIRAEYKLRFQRMSDQTAGVRVWGSTALNLAYVAAGKFDGFWDVDIKPWDTAAGIVLVREAGGLISRTNGQTYDPNASDIVASNDNLHTALIKQLNNST
jgi:myo-inositol-1(or 4)-monophosphatase